MEDRNVSTSKLLTLLGKHFINWFSRNWFQMALLFLIVQIISNSEVSQIEIRMDGRSGTNSFAVFKDNSTTVKTESTWKSSDFNNLSFILNPGLAAKKKVDDAIVSEKWKVCESYISKYENVALKQMNEFNIPASIILAQALLESEAGSSKLAKESKNHFGIKCRKKCRGCTCRNYADDDIYDMFRVFESEVESFVEHSQLLQMSRYKHLLKLDRKDYKSWAEGLKKAGYATDRNYHKKLIRIIETLKLYQFDA